MSTDVSLGDDVARELMILVGQAHVSVTRGALPFVVPSQLADGPSGSIQLNSTHPTVLNGAARGDIAALQVDVPGALVQRAVGTMDGLPPESADAPWSLTAVGPLAVVAGCPVMPWQDVLVRAECLPSTHGQRFDPLLRANLAKNA